jgi:hypothetical protein
LGLILPSVHLFLQAGLFPDFQACALDPFTPHYTRFRFFTERSLSLCPASWSPDGRHLALASTEGVITIATPDLSATVAEFKPALAVRGTDAAHHVRSKFLGFASLHALSTRQFDVV